MKKIFEAANQYCQACDWKDLAVLKFCLIALGIVIGLSIPAGGKTIAYILAGILFVVTFVPLMAKYFRILFKK